MKALPTKRSRAPDRASPELPWCRRRADPLLSRPPPRITSKPRIPRSPSRRARSPHTGRQSGGTPHPDRRDRHRPPPSGLAPDRTPEDRGYPQARLLQSPTIEALTCVDTTLSTGGKSFPRPVLRSLSDWRGLSWRAGSGRAAAAKRSLSLGLSVWRSGCASGRVQAGSDGEVSSRWGLRLAVGVRVGWGAGGRRRELVGGRGRFAARGQSWALPGPAVARGLSVSSCTRWILVRERECSPPDGVTTNSS